MSDDTRPTCIAFAGRARIASGTLENVAVSAKTALEADPAASILVFDTESSRPVELDLRGGVEDVRVRYAPAPPEPRSPGRPKLGVVAREITLLPRHWEWLASQPGGASVTLRKLVEAARRESAGADRVRMAQESAYRFALAMAGDEPGFEEATRALFADDSERFASLTEPWPVDVRDHLRQLARDAFTGEGE